MTFKPLARPMAPLETAATLAHNLLAVFQTGFAVLRSVSSVREMFYFEIFLLLPTSKVLRLRQ
jgi:hypothetical protein